MMTTADDGGAVLMPTAPCSLTFAMRSAPPATHSRSGPYIDASALKRAFGGTRPTQRTTHVAMGGETGIRCAAARSADCSDELKDGEEAVQQSRDVAGGEKVRHNDDLPKD